MQEAMKRPEVQRQMQEMQGAMQNQQLQARMAELKARTALVMYLVMLTCLTTSVLLCKKARSLHSQAALSLC